MNRIDARRSRRALAFAVWTIAAICLAGCAHYGWGYGGGPAVGFSVGTAYGPYWYPDGYGSFSVVRYPWWGDPPPPPMNDPAREGSITQRALADQLHESFAGRGYRAQPRDGDVDIAVYASSKPEMDITGYTHEYNWKNLPKLQNKMKYPKGTVIVDVLAPKTHELLWRGETVAPISLSDPAKYQADLRKAVEAIVAKYPKAKK